jgi:hypothetical protein
MVYQTYFFGCDECSDAPDHLEANDKVVLWQFIGYDTQVNVKGYKGAAIIRNDFGDEDDAWPLMFLDFSHLNQYYASFEDPNMSDMSLTGPDGSVIVVIKSIHSLISNGADSIKRLEVPLWKRPC